MISEEALQSFRKIWNDEFGVLLTDEDAETRAMEILRLFDAVYRPVQVDWIDEMKYGQNGTT